MVAYTTNFNFGKPTVGGDTNVWGGYLNTNFDTIDGILYGTGAEIRPKLTEGQWKIGATAVTASAAELNVLDGIPATLTATELGYVDGVTSAIQTQLNNISAGAQPLDDDLTALAALATTGIMARTAAATYVMRTLSAGNGVSVTDGNGVAGNPTVALSYASQAEAEAGVATDKPLNALRVAQAIDAQSGGLTLLGTIATTSGASQSLSSLTLTSYRKLLLAFRNVSHNSGSNQSPTLNGNRVANQLRSAAALFCGDVWVDLTTGVATGVVEDTTSMPTLNTQACMSASGYTTASTSITVGITGGAFDGGAVDVYGLK